jgi:hypothetical protein
MERAVRDNNLFDFDYIRQLSIMERAVRDCECFDFVYNESYAERSGQLCTARWMNDVSIPSYQTGCRALQLRATGNLFWLPLSFVAASLRYYDRHSVATPEGMYSSTDLDSGPPP